jgi:hypothetical protein
MATTPLNVSLSDSKPQTEAQAAGIEMQAKQSPNPVFGMQSSKDILEDALQSSAKSPYAVARPQLAARGGSHGELLIRSDPAIQWPLISLCAVLKRMQSCMFTF